MVTDDSSKIYDSVSYWNVNGDFNDKAYKNGIRNISGGVELCWGISNYGNRIYTLKYDISNFVTQYTDTQGIYFNFINLGQVVGYARIVIHSDIALSLDNARIWSFGYNGNINFMDGKIILDSYGALSNSQYMVGLVRFESNLFNTSNISNNSFDDIYDLAMESTNEVAGDNNYFNNLNYFKMVTDFIGFLIKILFRLCLNPLFLVFILYAILKKKKGVAWIWGSGKKSGYLDFGTYGKNLPSDDKINYWREIPCNKDIERAYWVAYNYNVVPTNELREGVIGAILLKWIKHDIITVSKTKKGLFSFKDNNYAINFSNIECVTNEIENKLLELLKDAAGLNKTLEAREFEKWCKKNYDKVQSWFLSFNSLEQIELEKLGLISNEQEETNGMFGKIKIITVKKVSPRLREDAIHLKGLKKFLLDFSMMPEREYFEVHVWEDYLIYAQLLGIADKVEEQFSKLYPKFNEETKLNINSTTIAIRNMAYLGYKGYEDGVQMAKSRNYSGSSRSSGGGGRSYSSGGSSSGGSSRGGFR